MKITVYSKPSCVQCNATYRALNKHSIVHEIVDLTQDPAAMDMVRAFNYQQAPVVVVTTGEGQVVDHWSGFRPDQIKSLAAQLAPAAA